MEPPFAYDECVKRIYTTKVVYEFEDPDHTQSSDFAVTFRQLKESSQKGCPVCTIHLTRWRPKRLDAGAVIFSRPPLPENEDTYGVISHHVIAEFSESIHAKVYGLLDLREVKSVGTYSISMLI